MLPARGIARVLPKLPHDKVCVLSVVRFVITQQRPRLMPAELECSGPATQSTSLHQSCLHHSAEFRLTALIYSPTLSALKFNTTSCSRERRDNRVLLDVPEGWSIRSRSATSRRLDRTPVVSAYRLHVYERRPIEIREGDCIRWSRDDKARTQINGERAKVKGIAGAGRTFDLRTGPRFRSGWTIPSCGISTMPAVPTCTAHRGLRRTRRSRCSPRARDGGATSHSEPGCYSERRLVANRRAN